jgi:hypothetical protein
VDLAGGATEQGSVMVTEVRWLIAVHASRRHASRRRGSQSMLRPLEPVPKGAALIGSLRGLHVSRLILIIPQPLIAFTFYLNDPFPSIAFSRTMDINDVLSALEQILDTSSREAIVPIYGDRLAAIGQRIQTLVTAPSRTAHSPTGPCEPPVPPTPTSSAATRAVDVAHRKRRKVDNPRKRSAIAENDGNAISNHNADANSGSYSANLDKADSSNVNLDNTADSDPIHKFLTALQDELPEIRKFWDAYSTLEILDFGVQDHPSLLHSQLAVGSQALAPSYKILKVFAEIHLATEYNQRSGQKTLSESKQGGGISKFVRSRPDFKNVTGAQSSIKIGLRLIELKDAWGGKGIWAFIPFAYTRWRSVSKGLVNDLTKKLQAITELSNYAHTLEDTIDRLERQYSSWVAEEVENRKKHSEPQKRKRGRDTEASASIKDVAETGRIETQSVTEGGQSTYVQGTSRDSD